MKAQTVYLCSHAQAARMEESGTLKAFIEEAERKYTSESLSEVRDRIKVLGGKISLTRLRDVRRRYLLHIGEDLRWERINDRRYVERKIGSIWIATDCDGDEFFERKMTIDAPRIERLCSQQELKANSKKLRNFLSGLLHRIEERTDDCWLLIGNVAVWHITKRWRYPHISINSYLADSGVVEYPYHLRGSIALRESERIGKGLDKNKQ